MTNIKEWSIALDESANDIERYENTLYKLYSGFKIPHRYGNSLMSGCYKKEPFSKHAVSMTIRTLIKSLIATAIIFIFSIIMIVGSMEGNFVENLKANSKSALTKSTIISIVSLILITAGIMGIKYLTYKSKIKILDSIEENNRQIMITVPSNYRNSEKMRTIAKVFFTKPTIDPNIILDVVDDFLKDSKPKAKYTAVMFNLPCECPFLDVSDSKSLMSVQTPEDEEQEKEKERNKFLPSDIDTKVFAGSVDSDKDLDNMIGLDSVKQQIERLKNRIAFYGKDAANNGNHMAFLGSAGTGKAQPLYSKVLTPNGFITMGDIKVGDKVISGNNKISTVLGVYPQGKKDIYEITFDDGSKCRCSDEHLWVVQDVKDRIKNTYQTLELQEIRKNITVKHGDGKRTNYSINYVSSINFEEKDLLIHPYLLGLLLGDGCLQTDSISISLYDEQLQKDIINFLPNGYKISKINSTARPNDCNYNIICDTPEKINKRPFIQLIKELGLLGKRSYEKFIPTEYLYASIEQRRWLLKGLLDTDGYAGQYYVEYSTASPYLRDNVIELVQSLGGYASYKEIMGRYVKNNVHTETRINYRIYIQFPKDNCDCFNLLRKKDNFNPKRESRIFKRFITDVTYIGKEECQCIYIDDESHTYITDNYIITHNTTIARIVTKIMYDLGYIKENQYIEISGDYLCAGSTSRASAIIEYSYGGVLFIDEAYLMYKSGAETVGVLLKAMEDHRTDFICILAGYEEQMTKLFASNEGFSSRIKHNIYFTDYDENEMLDIFNSFISNYNGKSYKLNDDAVDTLLNAFRLEKKSKSFGNARTVRNCVDAIMDNYADRSISTKTDTKVISLEDVELFANERRKVLSHEIKNAGAVNQLDESIIRLAELKPRLKEGSKDPDSDIKKLVGLESFVDEMNVLNNQKEFYGDTTHQSILLIGDNGCGKSSLTKILTGYLYKMGYIEENKYLDIPAEFLKGSYVGHTAKRAEAIISYASGGVLYITNYNALVDSNDSFASEVISAINTAISENTNVTIVLADSQSDSIESLRSIFTITYDFPEYTSEQLLEIFKITASNENFLIEDEALNIVSEYIESNKLKVRDIQQIFTNSVKNHITNFNGDERLKYIISKEDIVLPSKKLKLKINK